MPIPRGCRGDRPLGAPPWPETPTLGPVSRWIRRGVRLLIAAALAWGAATGTTAAHAHLVAAEPAPDSVQPTSPPTLTLRFDAALADTGSTVVLYQSDRRPVGDLAIQTLPGPPPTVQARLPQLAPGIYTVAWTSVSAEDGHRLSQFYAFTVGAVPPAEPGPVLPPLKAGDTSVLLRLGRGNVGPTTIEARVLDAAGQPVANLQRVIVRYRPVGLEIGEDEIVAPARGDRAATPSFTLGLAGEWDLTVIVRRTGLNDVSANARLALRPAPATLVPPSPLAAARTTAALPSVEPSSPAGLPSLPAPSPTPGQLVLPAPSASPVPAERPLAAPAVGAALALLLGLAIAVVRGIRRRSDDV